MELLIVGCRDLLQPLLAGDRRLLEVGENLLPPLLFLNVVLAGVGHERGINPDEDDDQLEQPGWLAGSPKNCLSASSSFDRGSYSPASIRVEKEMTKGAKAAVSVAHAKHSKSLYSESDSASAVSALLVSLKGVTET